MLDKPGQTVHNILVMGIHSRMAEKSSFLDKPVLDKSGVIVHTHVPRVLYTYHVSSTRTMCPLHIPCVLYTYHVSSTHTMCPLHVPCVLYTYHVSSTLHHLPNGAVDTMDICGRSWVCGRVQVCGRDSDMW